MFSFADDLGPVKIVHVQEPSLDLKAVLVVDNVATGPAIGGVRMATDVTTEECVRLARAMTFKNAAAGLPHGGGKVVLYGDPKMPRNDKEQRIRALARLLRGEQEYIFAPDMGTDEECMAWVRDEISRVVALPREIGLSHAVDVALRYCDFELEGARLVVQGFGAVGKHVTRFLTGRGAKLVAVADSCGATHNPQGLDVAALLELKDSGKSVCDFPDGTAMDRDAVIDIECDIWIPAARPDVVNEENVQRLNTRLVVEGANIPFTHGAEETLHEKGVLCVPDFIANAGGVICAAMEYHGSTQSAALQTIEEKLRRNTEQVLETARREQVLPRQAAMAIAEQRVRKAMGFRRWSLFSSAPDYT
jgi:glutamate dehydrogenase (NAD(P)+)